MFQNAGQCQGHAVASVSMRLCCLSQIGAISGTVLNSELGISSLTSSEAHKLPVQELNMMGGRVNCTGRNSMGGE